MDSEKEIKDVRKCQRKSLRERKRREKKEGEQFF